MIPSIVQSTDWTAPGSDVAAQRTYASIKNALEPVIARADIDPFLQGSYANATNIRADSDVDIVVMTRQTFVGSRSILGAQSARKYDELPSADYTAHDLRRDLTELLVSTYGSDRVSQKNKCIRVEGRNGLLDADVVPAIQYRRYTHPASDVHSEFVEGICINPLEGSAVVNYPKEHIKNGQAKNAQCMGRYKATVRQVKRLRARAVQDGVLYDGQVSGYLLECLIFNVPALYFVPDDSARLLKVLEFLLRMDLSQFSSCDNIHHLFVDDPGRFNVEDADYAIRALLRVL